MDIEKIKSQKTIQELLEFGILNIDKPSGPTSFDVSNMIHNLLEKSGVKKTSHFGTLDPKVTGVLPIALSRACKLTGFFLGEDKEYVGIMRMHEEVPLDKIRKVIEEKFTGKIMQKPPVRSRVKRQEREREVKSFELIEKNENDIVFRAEVQGGTYIRKLIDDLGKELDIGAHMLELRRIRAGIFEEDGSQTPTGSSVNLYDFEEAVKKFEEGDESYLRKIIIPAEIVAEVYPLVKVNKKYEKDILTGKPILKEAVMGKVEVGPAEIVSVFCDGKFLGMFKVIDDKEKNIFAKPEFVLQPIKG